MNRYLWVLLACLAASGCLKTTGVAHDSGSIQQRENILEAKLVAVGIKVRFPVSGFIRFERTGDGVPGLTQSDLIAYGDSYGVFNHDAPTHIAPEDLKLLAAEYNRISLEKYNQMRVNNQSKRQDKEGQQSVGGADSPAPQP